MEKQVHLSELDARDLRGIWIGARFLCSVCEGNRSGSERTSNEYAKDVNDLVAGETIVRGMFGVSP